jgi:hypothetical protein
LAILAMTSAITDAWFLVGILRGVSGGFKDVGIAGWSLFCGIELTPGYFDHLVRGRFIFGEQTGLGLGIHFSLHSGVAVLAVRSWKNLLTEY